MQRNDNPGNINRAGLIPFYFDESGQIHMMFMVPTPNPWIECIPQVCKGRVEPGEILMRTAIREAEEELGLNKANLVRIEPVGQFSTIMMYVGEIRDPTDFGTFSEIETQSVIWMTPERFMEDGRALHRDVVRAAEEKIKELLNVA